jgi:hypothetical protein
LTLLLGLGLLTAVIIRLTLGSRPVYRAGLTRRFLVLALTQVGFFVVQETLEALSVHAAPDFLAIAMLAVIAQLPLAALAAWLISWIAHYVQLAPEAVRAMLAVRLGARRTAVLLRSVATVSLRSDILDQGWYPRRGPPLL